MNAVEALTQVLTRGQSGLATMYKNGSSGPLNSPFGLPMLRHIKMAYNQNPYHNFEHAQHVAHCCKQLISLYGVTVEDGANELLFAALMHDARHSGGTEPDSINVKRAISAAAVVASHKRKVKLDIGLVSDLIAVTEFDSVSRRFKHSPSTMCEKIIRDADLLGFTSPNWPRMLAGLFIEVYGDKPASDEATLITEAELMLRTNLEFLRGCTFYTDFARTAFAEYSIEVSRMLPTTE